LTGLILQPSANHIGALQTDYEQMQEMLFGSKPSFDELLDVLVNLEAEIHSL